MRRSQAPHREDVKSRKSRGAHLFTVLARAQLRSREAELVLGRLRLLAPLLGQVGQLAFARAGVAPDVAGSGSGDLPHACQNIQRVARRGQVRDHAKRAALRAMGTHSPAQNMNTLHTASTARHMNRTPRR